MDEYRVKMLAYEEWLFTKDRLEILNRIQAALPAETSSFGNFQNFPSSVTVKPKVVRPKWSGATPEYMRAKRAESKNRMKNAVCIECGKPRKPKKHRCFDCDEVQVRRQEDMRRQAQRLRRAAKKMQEAA